MTPIQELPDIERLIFHTLFFLPEESGTIDQLISGSYYPASEVTTSVAALVERGDLTQIHTCQAGTMEHLQQYRPNSTRLLQMHGLNRSANQQLRQGLAEAFRLAESGGVDLATGTDQHVVSLWVDGQHYNLADYLTYQQYSERYEVALPLLTLRINRGNVDPADLLTVPRYGVKLIRDAPPAPLRRGPKKTEPDADQ